MIETVDALIDALGGSAALGAALGIGRTAVEMWSTRGFVPNGWHFRLFVLCCRHSIRVSPAVFDLSREDFDCLVKYAKTAADPAAPKVAARRAG